MNKSSQFANPAKKGTKKKFKRTHNKTNTMVG
jgi:hypothetical protein